MISPKTERLEIETGSSDLSLEKLVSMMIIMILFPDYGARCGSSIDCLFISIQPAHSELSSVSIDGKHLIFIVFQM